MKHILQLLILIVLIGFFENCSKMKADISPVNPAADFSYEIKDGIVTFTNKSENAVKYLWDFGDGQTSDEKDPVHTYIKAGEYKVKLTAESIDGIKSTKILDVIIVDKALDARFTLNATSYDTPCIMNFKNESTAKEQYFEWDFGDGLYSRIEKKPTHIYLFGGTYTITFTIRDASSKILAQNKQQIVVKETFLPKANKTTIISRVKRAADKSVIGRDTTTIVYNDLDKIAFARVRNGLTIGNSLLTFDYSKTEPKYTLYSSTSYTFASIKLNDKGYLTEISDVGMNGIAGNKYLYQYDENNYIKQLDTQQPSGGVYTFYYRTFRDNIIEEIATAGYGVEYESSTELNTLSTDFLFYLINGDDNFYVSFMRFIYAKPYRNLIKSVTGNGISKTELTYFKDSQGKITKVIATNLSDRSTVETSISYQ
jgi:PKD repeat protein